MIHFYIGKYRIELRKVKNIKSNRKFLFIKYFKSKTSKLCISCNNVRPQFKNCKIGIYQQDRKSCRYHTDVYQY